MLINFLVSTLIYMSLPLWPAVVEKELSMDSHQVGLSLLSFSLGLLVPGCVCSYLLDIYKRKSVCFWLVVLLATSCLFLPLDLPFHWILFVRFLQGVAFFAFHIALGNTIMVDITISERRDFASYIYFWICRFALAIGPLMGMMLFSSLSYVSPYFARYVHWLPFLGVMLALYCLVRLKVPFRTPMRNVVFSLDRFWLPRCFPLVAVLFCVAFCVGVQMALHVGILYYVYLLSGFVLSLILHFAVFYRADIRAEVVTGFLAMVASFLLLVFEGNNFLLLSAGLSGYGLACISGKFLKFFTVVSDHTERGSAQGTYKLTFEFAFLAGFAWACLWQVSLLVAYVSCLVISILSMCFYLAVVHPWFLRHTRR